MKLGVFQKIMLFAAVAFFGGFLFSFLRSLDWGVLGCGTGMGVSFLILLTWGEMAVESRQDSELAEDEEDEHIPQTHMDSLLDQLADRRRQLDEAEDRLSVSEEELEKANEALLAAEQEAERQKSAATAMAGANEKLKEELERLKEERSEAEREASEKITAESILPQTEGSEKEIISLSRAAQTAADDFADEAKKAGVRIAIVSPDKDLLVSADPYMLDILFKNIIDNAIKYMGRQGTLQITLSEVGEELFIVMKDNGEGLARQETDHIFELNYQGSNRISGNGLGLAQARAIVSYFGGMIYARSNRGSGMGIYIHLPAA